MKTFIPGWHVILLEKHELSSQTQTSLYESQSVIPATYIIFQWVVRALLYLLLPAATCCYLLCPPIPEMQIRELKFFYDSLLAIKKQIKNPQ